MVDEGGEVPKPSQQGEAVKTRDPNEGAPPGVQRFFIEDSGRAKKLVEEVREELKGKPEREVKLDDLNQATDADIMRSSQWRRDALERRGKTELETSEKPAEPKESSK